MGSKIIGTFGLIVGSSILFFGILSTANTLLFLSRAVTTQGLVVDLVRIATKNPNHPAYYPLVRFTTESGRTIEFRSQLTVEGHPQNIGDRVPVLYDPNNPEDAQINDPSNRWLQFSLFCLGGVGFLGFGLMGFLFSPDRLPATKLEEGERVLYRHKPFGSGVVSWTFGSVLVTDKRIVLSNKVWRFSDIESIQLVSRRVLSRRLSRDQLLSKSSCVSFLVAGILVFLVLFIDFSGFSRTQPSGANGLRLILLTALDANIVYVMMRHPAEVYKMQLTLKNGQQQEASNIWYADDKRSADETIRAVQHALTKYQDLP